MQSLFIKLQENLEADKGSKIEKLDSVLQGTDKRVYEWNDQNNKAFNQLKESMNELQRYFEEDKAQKELLYESRTQELKTLETKVHARVESEVAARRDLERRLNLIVDEKLAVLRGDVQKEAKNRAESIEHLKSCLEVTFHFI